MSILGAFYKLKIFVVIYCLLMCFWVHAKLYNVTKSNVLIVSEESESLDNNIFPEEIEDRASVVEFEADDITDTETLALARKQDFEDNPFKVYRVNGEEIVVYSHEYISSLSSYKIARANIRFLKNYNTPCFFEEIFHKEGSEYIDNRQITASGYPKKYEFYLGIRESKPTYLTLSDLDNKKVRLRCLPQFMLLGVAKSGTTDFGVRVTIHPSIFKGIKKELYWWDQYRFTINSSVSDYSDMFDTAISQIMTREENNTGPNLYYKAVAGDMTSITLTDVAHWRQDPRNRGLKEPRYLTPHDVYGLNSNIKLIVLLRNPVSRLYSHYNMFRRFKDPSPENFHMLVVNSIKWWEDCTKILPLRGCLYGSPPEMPVVEHEIKSWWPLEQNYTGQIRDGLYYYLIKDWLDVIPRGNFLFIRSDDYNADKLSVMNKVFAFLGVETVDGALAEEIRDMKNQYKKGYPPILPETAELLRTFYEQSNIELANLLGDEKWLWKET